MPTEGASPAPAALWSARRGQVTWRRSTLVAAAVVGAATLITLIAVPANVLDPVARIEAGQAALAIGFGVLALDAIAPVPSSAVMIALGAFAGFGAAAAVSTAGLLTAALVGYTMGHLGTRVARWDSGGPPLWTTGTSRTAILAVIASRPIPLVAETTAMAAGAVGMRLSLFIPSAAVGGLAPAVVYAALGSGLTSEPSWWLVSVATITLVALALGVHRFVAPRS